MSSSLFKITVVQHWLYNCWIDADGNPCGEGEAGARFVASRKVKAGTPGSAKVTKKSGKWYGRVPGQKKPVPLSPNKVVAQQMLAKLTVKAGLASAGISDPFEEHRRRPLAEHLKDWEAVLKARRNTDVYVEMKVGQARKVIDACRFVFIADFSASRVEAALAEMRCRPRFGTQTSNHYLSAVKQFTRWLVRDRRAAENPLSHLEGGNVRLDSRHQRRELADDELARLLDAAHAGRPVRGMPGRDREMLYLSSVYTGLRASELASLTPESFALDGSPPTVAVAAAYSKHRREDVVPLHADLVRRLRVWLAGRPARQPVWPGKWAEYCWAGAMLKSDLKAARAAWINEGEGAAEQEVRSGSDFLAERTADGRVIDFHGLRHTFITRLVKAGVKPKEAQALARHSTITLTMDRYAHTGLHDTARAVESLPSLPPSRPESRPQPMKATGTDAVGLPPVCTGFAKAVDTGRSPLMPVETFKGAESGQGGDSGGDRNPPILKVFAPDRGEMMPADTNGEGGNQAPRFSQPLSFSALRTQLLAP